MNRRAVISLIGSAAAWPLVARAQQAPMPVIGFLDSRTPDAISDRLRAFRQGLSSLGYVEGENVAISYRFADNRIERLPELAAELVRRKVAVIVTGVPPGAFAAKAATATIPIVFLVGKDPVDLGLVASIARPGGNLTGVNFLTTELAAKRLELLRELVPALSRIAVLVNPADLANTDPILSDVDAAARALGLQTTVYKANTIAEIDAAFAGMSREKPDALFVGGSPYFAGRRVQLAQLTAFYRLPATYSQRETPEVGGLMSYGASVVDAYRQLGVYAGRILKGAKPADLPVEQASKFELVINAHSARMLGLEISPKLLALADEVIE
jgi:putative ABC transport system substrate-binding protein